MMPKPEQFAFPFLRKTQLAKDAFEFYFDSSHTSFSFIPGQYVRMILPHENADDRGTTRLFSVTTLPTNKQEISIVTRIIQSSFKKTLSSLTPGTPVNFFGPLGRFIIDDKQQTPLVLLAGGIGITPYISIVRALAENHVDFPITLFASFTTPEEMIYYQEMVAVEATLPSLKVVYTCTHPEESTTSWNGETGRISKEMIQKYVPEVLHARYYISGPQAMVLAMESLVTELGVPVEQVKKEQFIGY